MRSRDVKESGYFGIVNPKSIFGHYPSEYVAGDDSGISAKLADISASKGYKGTRRQQQQQVVGVSFEAADNGLGEELQSVADEIEDSSNEFTGAVADMEKLEKAFRGHFRKIR